MITNRFISNLKYGKPGVVQDSGVVFPRREMAIVPAVGVMGIAGCTRQSRYQSLNA
jgi:hypothetical protein